MSVFGVGFFCDSMWNGRPVKHLLIATGRLGWETKRLIAEWQGTGFQYLTLEELRVLASRLGLQQGTEGREPAGNA